MSFTSLFLNTTCTFPEPNLQPCMRPHVGLTYRCGKLRLFAWNLSLPRTFQPPSVLEGGTSSSPSSTSPTRLFHCNVTRCQRTTVRFKTCAPLFWVGALVTVYLISLNKYYETKLFLFWHYHYTRESLPTTGIDAYKYLYDKAVKQHSEFLPTYGVRSAI